MPYGYKPAPSRRRQSISSYRTIIYHRPNKFLTSSEAKQKPYTLTDKDLDGLDYIEKYNRHNPRAPIRLFKEQDLLNAKKRKEAKLLEERLDRKKRVKSEEILNCDKRFVMLWVG